MELLRLTLLFAVTAVAEIVGCYLPWLVLKQGKSLLLLFPAALSLALFAWLLTLHPTAAGRTYAAYGGMYIAVALLWLHFRGRHYSDSLGCVGCRHCSYWHGGDCTSTYSGLNSVMVSS